MTTASNGPDRDTGGCEKRHCHRAKRGEGGGVCHRPAGWGTDHVGFGSCKLHGGATASHTAAARVEQARQAVATYGLARTVDPAQALLEEVHRTAGHVAWLQAKVAELEEADLVWGVTDEVEKTATEFPGTDTTRKAAVNVWLELYRAERKHLTEVCAKAIACGIAERQIKLAEQQGAMLASVIGRILDDLELTPAQRTKVPEVVPRHLRAVS